MMGIRDLCYKHIEDLVSKEDDAMDKFVADITSRLLSEEDIGGAINAFCFTEQGGRYQIDHEQFKALAHALYEAGRKKMEGV